MPNAVRARAAGGNRAPGLIDTETTKAIRFHFSNMASLEFGGTDEYVEGPTMSSAGTFTDQFTVALWFKWSNLDTPDQWQGIANANTNWSSLQDGWGLFWNNATTLRAYINSYSSNFVQATISDPDGDWTFIAMTYEGTQIELYVNGSSVGTDSLTGDITAQSSNIEIGRTANTNTPAADHTIGHIDEFSIWNSAPEASEIEALYNNGTPQPLNTDVDGYVSSSSLRLWWRCGDLNDSNGADGIQDQSLNGNHGTMMNMEAGDIDTTDFPGTY